MTNKVLSEAIKEAYASAPTDVVIIQTLEIRHPDFVDEDGNLAAIRITKEHLAFDATLEASAPINAGETVTFTPLAFNLSQPKVDDKSSPEVNISIDNINRHFTINIERAIESQKPVKVTYRPYLSTDLSMPHFDPPLHLTLRNIVVNLTSLSARARFGDLPNQSFPGALYTAEEYPALVR